MEEKKTARQWCDEAVSYVRFRPDRSAIRRELTQHLMDSRFQLLDQGLDTETADARSVADMGDPQTVGLALDRAAARLLLRNPDIGSVVVAHVAVVHPSPLPSGQEFLPQVKQPGQLEGPLHLLLPLRL